MNFGIVGTKWTVRNTGLRKERFDCTALGTYFVYSHSFSYQNPNRFQQLKYTESGLRWNKMMNTVNAVFYLPLKHELMRTAQTQGQVCAQTKGLSSSMLVSFKVFMTQVGTTLHCSNCFPISPMSQIAHYQFRQLRRKTVHAFLFPGGVVLPFKLVFQFPWTQRKI